MVLFFVTACGSSAPSSGEPRADDPGAPDSGASSVVLPPVGHGSFSSSPQASSTAPAASSATSSQAASAASDAGAPPGSAGVTAALAAASPDTWTWVPVPGSACGNGTPTGIAWNPHAGATELLVFLEGGGACYDADSCWGASATASYMTGYGLTEFASDYTPLAVIFDRTAAANPFRAMNIAFVPYCTGDLHVGNAVVSYTVNGVPTPTYFKGAENIDTFAAALAAAAQSTLSRVYLGGDSAGGFGSFLNQDAVARAFGGMRVDMIDDSGPAVAGATAPPDWNARFPPACADCTDLTSTFQYVRATYPDSRYGLLTFQTDTTLPEFFGETDAAFATLIQQFVSGLAPDPNAKAFVDTSSGHVVLAETDPTAVPFILPWLTQLVTDEPTWATVSH